MNKILVIIGSAIVVASLILTGLTISRPVNVKVEIPETQLGGMDIYHAFKVHGAFNWGGNASTTNTVSAAVTISGSDMANYGMFDLMINVAASTYTLPATSTMISLLPDIGSSRKWLFHNATSTGAMVLTIAKGAGMDLVGVGNAADVIDAGEWAELTCTQIYYRTADNENILCIITELENAD